MWTETQTGKSWIFEGRNGRYSVVKINDVGGKRNYSTRRAAGFVETLVGYSLTLGEAKARAEQDDAK